MNETLIELNGLAIVALVWIVMSFIKDIVSDALKGKNIRENGYPPAHCDALGDQLEDSKPLISVKSKKKSDD